jgi:hypothetical protein
MTIIRNLIVMILMAALSALAQSAPSPSPLTSYDAKNHLGEMATVCGKVVDTKIPKYGIAGHGKPVTFDLDQPEPKPVFYFVAFGSESGGPQEAIAAYQGKSVCVTGKIAAMADVPFILAADRSRIRIQTESK